MKSIINSFNKTPRKINYFIWIALICLPLFTFWNILHNDLFLDDLDYIVNNAYIRDLRYLPNMFLENLVAGAGKSSDYYRPLILVVFGFLFPCTQLNPIGYHAASLFFHILNVLLLYKLLAKTIQGCQIPFWTTLLFAVHPVQSEAIASASALGIPMGMFFLLLAALGYIRVREHPSKMIYLLTFLCVPFALLSKETMVILPGILFLIEFFFLSQQEKLIDKFRDSLLRSLPYLAIVLFYIFLRFTILNFGGTGNLFRQENIFTQNPLARFYTFLTVLLEIFKILFWPKTLFMERAAVMPIYIHLAKPVLLGLALLLGLFVLIYAGIKRNNKSLIAFGTVWFLFGLVPVSNLFIPISTILVESWLYQPMIGLALILCFVLYSSKIPEKWATFFLIAAVAACSLKTVQQNKIWKDPITFYEHTLRHAPKSARFRNNLAMAYADQKRYNDCIREYRLAIQTNDQYPETHHNLANSLLEIGMVQEAELEFRRAIQKDRKFFYSYVSLAALYYNYKRLDLAQSVLESLIENAPYRWEGYYNLGIVYQIKGDTNRAITLWQKGLSLDPYNKNLREALDRARFTVNK